MSNIRKKITTVLAVLLCAALAIAVSIATPRVGNAAGSDNKIDEITVSTGNNTMFSAENLLKLYSKLTTKTTANFSDVEDMFNTGIGGKEVWTAADLIVQAGSEYTVTFAGIEWVPVYLSQTQNKSSVVLTLWQADVGSTKYQWNEYVADPSTNYPSAMYSTSYIHTTVLNNGGNYKSEDGSSVSEVVQSTTNEYARFTVCKDTLSNSVESFLVAPKEMAWQVNQSSAIASGTQYDYANDALSRANWVHSVTQGIQDKDKYSDWGNDKIWLPSYAEIGGGAGWGLWKTTKNQRTFNPIDSSNNNVWLRSVYSTPGADPWFLTYDVNSGGYVTYSGVANNITSEYYIRPAINLNLTLADKNAGEIEKPTNLLKEETYNGNQIEFDLSTYKYFSYGKPTNGATFEAGILKATQAGEYTVTATPVEGEWKDGSADPVTFTLKINKKPIELEIELSSYTHEVGKPPASITASIKPPNDGVFASCDNWEDLCKGVQFSVTGGISVDGLLNATVGSYTVSATLVLDNYDVTFKSATYTVASHSTHKYDGEAEHIAGTKMHKVYCSYDGCSEYDTKPCTISSQTPHEETCLLDGYTEYVCSDCGVYTIKGANKKAHDFTDQPWVTDDNQHWHECSYGCNTTDTKADHRWQQKGEIVWDNDSGTRTDECKDCGKTRQITVYPGEKTVPALKDKTYIYNGNPQEAELSDFEASAMTLEYYDEYKSNSLDGAPAGAGKYYVKVTLTEAGSKFQGTEERFVWIEFVIQKKAIILEIELSGTCHEIGNAPASITASIKKPSSGVFVGSDDWKELCNGVQFTVTDCNVLEDLINAAVGSYEVNATLVLDNYEVTIKPVKYEIVAHEHRFDGQDWQSDENKHWHDCVQGDAKGDESPHDWDEGIITREATEEQAGERTFTCETCGATRTEAVEYVPPEDDLKDKKQEAKDALDEVAQKKKDEIDSSDMSDEEKKAAKDKVDEELQKGKDAIDSATSSSGIDSVFNESKKNIENIAIKGRGSSFPWWIFIIIGGVLLLLALLIVIIVKRRQTADGEDEYDDYYDDEYNFDEEVYKVDDDFDDLE